MESKRVLRRRPRSLPVAPRARSKWPRGCPWVSLRPSPCPCRRSSPRQRRLLVPMPSARLMGYAARPSPLSRLRPSGSSMTLLCAYRVLSCWPAATRAVGTFQRERPARCQRAAALVSMVTSGCATRVPDGSTYMSCHFMHGIRCNYTGHDGCRMRKRITNRVLSGIHTCVMSVVSHITHTHPLPHSH